MARKSWCKTACIVIVTWRTTSGSADLMYQCSDWRRTRKKPLTSSLMATAVSLRDSEFCSCRQYPALWVVMELTDGYVWPGRRLMYERASRRLPPKEEDDRVYRQQKRITKSSLMLANATAVPGDRQLPKGSQPAALAGRSGLDS